MQPTDATRSAREAYTGCLRAYVQRSLESRMSPAEFGRAFPQQCTTQEAAFRAAVVRRELSSRMSQADAAESATLEIDEAKTNFRERFDMAQPASSPPAAQPAAAATAQAAPQPAPGAATPASASTPQ